VGLTTARMTTDEERFWAQVDRSDGPDACWPWTGAQNPRNGYGYLTYRSAQRFAHRVALELSGQEIPVGLLVMHTCENPLCCNPAHLKVGTRADHMQRRSRLRHLRPPESEE
jgi:hypothetical protein